MARAKSAGCTVWDSVLIEKRNGGGDGIHLAPRTLGPAGNARFARIVQKCPPGIFVEPTRKVPVTSSSPIPPQIKKAVEPCGLTGFFKWRRGWDSNPRKV